jgi:hypothetical protein
MRFLGILNVQDVRKVWNNDMFPRPWTGNTVPMEWTPQSPALNTMDFVFSTPVDTFFTLGRELQTVVLLSSPICWVECTQTW